MRKMVNIMSNESAPSAALQRFLIVCAIGSIPMFIVRNEDKLVE